jgi:hypothetical protein
MYKLCILLLYIYVLYMYTIGASISLSCGIRGIASCLDECFGNIQMLCVCIIYIHISVHRQGMSCIRDLSLHSKRSAVKEWRK